MSDKKKKDKSDSSKVILMVVSVAFGAVVGILMADTFLEKEKSPFMFLIGLAAILLSFFLIIILHEAGHLLMGLLTGYKFVSFRVGSLTFVKENGKMKTKRFNIPGTGGQCLLDIPDNAEPADVPFKLYHLGGVLVNFVLAAAAMTVSLLIPKGIVGEMLFIFGFMNLVLGIMNVIPMGSNDGKNFQMMSKSRGNREAVNNQLHINALMSNGITPDKIDEKYFRCSDADCEFAYISTMLKASRELVKMQFEDALRDFETVLDDKNINEIYKYECTCDKMFCMMMLGADKAEIDEIYDKKLKNYIKQLQKYIIGKVRLMYAYELVINKNSEAAEKLYNSALKMRDTYPISGDYTAEMQLIEYVRNNH